MVLHLLLTAGDISPQTVRAFGGLFRWAPWRVQSAAMADIDAVDQNLDQLRQRAIDRAAALLMQLEADHADLLRHQDHCKTPGIDTGIEAVDRVIESARRVRSQMQGG